jgi:hypothetical protein
MERTLAQTESRVAQLAREAERLSDDAARLRRVTSPGASSRREDLGREDGDGHRHGDRAPRRPGDAQAAAGRAGGDNGSPHEATVHLRDWRPAYRRRDAGATSGRG